MVSPAPRSVAPSFAWDLILASSSMVYMIEPERNTSSDLVQSAGFE